MQLDYRQFVMKIEKISEVKPVPYQDFVSTYVKAYYIPELDLEDWVKEHSVSDGVDSRGISILFKYIF
mgnify:CR=1 FL=1